MEQLTYSFLPSHQLQCPLEIKAVGLELPVKQAPLSSEIFRDPKIAFIGAHTKTAFEFYLTVQLWSDNKNLWPEMQTKYRHNRTHKVLWNQTLNFADISDLPRNSQLAFNVWDLKGPGQKYPYLSTTASIFDKDGILKKGRQKLLLHSNVKADPYINTSTPAECTETTEMDRLEELVKAHEAGDIPRVEWLDNLAFRQLEKVASVASQSTNSFLIVEYPRFDFPVLYASPDYSYTIKADVNIHQNSLVMVYDPEAHNQNPIESKHRRLVRSHRNGPLDKDLKPSPRIRDTLRDIITQPVSSELTSEEKDLLWRFRYHLSRLPNALPKFLRSVVWSDTVERSQAVALLSRWSTISVDSALELLGPSFTNADVRNFAVARMLKAEDIDVMLYLLQLVQALRYEPEDSPLCAFLVQKGKQNDRIGTQLFWYLTVESGDPSPAPVFFRARQSLLSSITTAQKSYLEKQEKWVSELTELSESIKVAKDNRLKKIDKLRAWASERASLKGGIPFPLDPTLEVTGFNPEACSVFKSSLFPLRLSLKTNTSQNALLRSQREESGHEELDQREAAISNIDPGSFDAIFKSGDDLRQDQLVIQIITLFNDLLLRENLDLKLTPYRILATSPTSGFVEFVESSPLASILSEYGTLANYLGATATRRVDEEVMDTYVRSCAGYCVITYLLGVGDRHLDNLLLTKSGHFFHADFGFILGRDPKPFAPALKLVKEMVDVMNTNSPSHDQGFWYARFKSYSFTAFSALRKNSGLVLNLFSLMVDANIPDIKIEPTRAVGKIMERFCLEMDEEQSLRFFEGLLIESVSALFPVLIDRVHNIAQYLRA